MIFQGNPIVGLDANGDPINMLLTSIGESQTSSYIDNIGQVTSNGANEQPAAANSWKVTQVQAIAHNGSDVVALGYGTDNLGNVTDLAWVLKSGTWTVGPFSTNALRPSSVAFTGSVYAVADTSNIRESDFLFLNKPPAGTLAGSEPNALSSSSDADSMASGPVGVGSSIAVSGVWVGPTWTHQAGLPVEVLTGHYATSYTFPGASGFNLQVQLVSTVPPATAIPPSEWDTPGGSGPNLSKGYYGLIDSPHFDVTWTSL